MSEGVQQAASMLRPTGWNKPQAQGREASRDGAFGEALELLEKVAGEANARGGGDGEAEASSDIALEEALEMLGRPEGAEASGEEVLVHLPDDALRLLKQILQADGALDGKELPEIGEMDLAAADAAIASAIEDTAHLVGSPTGDANAARSDGGSGGDTPARVAIAAALLAAAGARSGADGSDGTQQRAASMAARIPAGADAAEQLVRALEPGGDAGSRNADGESGSSSGRGTAAEAALRALFEKGGDAARNMSGEFARLDNAGAKVNVIGGQSVPAPVAPQPGATATSLVAALDADSSFRAAAADPASAPQTGDGPRANGVVHTLKIQLHPAELGMVAARLRIVGEQLSVELQVDSNDARNRLAADSDAMTRALRASGYEVDKVTVMQSTTGGGTATGSGAGREGAFQTAGGNSGGTNGNSSNARGGEDGDGHEQNGERQTRDQAGPGRGDLYI